MLLYILNNIYYGTFVFRYCDLLSKESSTVSSNKAMAGNTMSNQAMSSNEIMTSKTVSNKTMSSNETMTS